MVAQTRVRQCIKSHLFWSDLELLRDIMFVLCTHGWEKALEKNDDTAAIDRLVARFAVNSSTRCGGKHR